MNLQFANNYIMQLLQKSILFSFIIFIAFSCKKVDEINSITEYLSRDDTSSKVLREYKKWVVSEASIERTGLPTITYKVGLPIQNNFNPSNISFVFYSTNNVYTGITEKGVQETGQWRLNDAGTLLEISTTTSGDKFDILKLTKTNLDIKNDETYDDKPAVVTIKMVPSI